MDILEYAAKIRLKRTMTEVDIQKMRQQLKDQGYNLTIFDQAHAIHNFAKTFNLQNPMTNDQ